MIDQLLAQGLVPDPFIRLGIRKFLKQRLTDEKKNQRDMVEFLSNSPIAIDTDKANDQHYQVPTEFYEYCLGKNKKYSCCYWDKAKDLDQAELEMLELTVERADIKDGIDILELGCGWGAITLFMAKKFPNSKITAVSNSATQRQFIEAEAKKRNLPNVKIITRNVATLEMQDTFDRIISVEMFEHMRNYKKLLNNISSWLKPDGKLFVHIFVHKDMTYTFDVKDESDWMSKYFFSGGIMPSEHLLYYFSEDMVIGKHWVVNGIHYAKTARAWLENTDKNKDKIISLFEKHYGKTEAHKWFHYWRVFFLSCEELWNYKNGEEWYVGHYLLSPRKH